MDLKHYLTLDLTLVLHVQDCKSGNAVFPFFPVLRHLDSIIHRHLQASQVLSNSSHPVLSWPSSPALPLRSPVDYLVGSSVTIHSGHMSHPVHSFLSDDVL